MHTRKNFQFGYVCIEKELKVEQKFSLVHNFELHIGSACHEPFSLGNHTDSSYYEQGGGF